MQNSTPITYLISRYPAISHTFILREILHLKKMGMTIRVASINRPDREDDALTSEELEEKTQTEYIKHQALKGAFGAMIYALSHYPGAYFSTLFESLKLSNWSLNRVLYHGFYFLEASIVAKSMHETGSQHVHVHFASEVCTVGLFVKKLISGTLSVYVHGPDEFYDKSLYLLPEKIKAADHLFCISSFARSQVMLLSEQSEWHKMSICRLGVDTERFNPSKKPEKEAGLVSILCVGRLTPAKGQHILIQAMTVLLKRGLGVELVLVGPGTDEQSLKRQVKEYGIENSVTFTGAVNQDKIMQYLCAADIFCLPSFAEGVPVSLMEAMAMEIPCVSTQITGISELIANQRDGILVTASDIEELAYELERLVVDEKWRAQIGKAGREKVIEKYDLAKNTEHFGQTFTNWLEISHQQDKNG